MNPPPIQAPVRPATADEIMHEAREAIAQFNIAVVRLQRATAAMQAHFAVRLVKQRQ